MTKRSWIGLTSVIVIAAACGGGSGQGKSASMGGPAAGGPTQAVVTAIPEPAGAISKRGQLPPEITGLPTAEPETMAAPEAAMADSAPRAASDPANPMSTLIGQAWYAGPACAQATWPPSCNGAYRATWVWIWSHSAGTWLRSAQTDDDGRYTFIVEPGWYTIMFKTGFADGWWWSKVNVAPFETTTANLVVDYGVR